MGAYGWFLRPASASTFNAEDPGVDPLLHDDERELRLVYRWKGLTKPLEESALLFVKVFRSFGFLEMGKTAQKLSGFGLLRHLYLAITDTVAENDDLLRPPVVDFEPPHERFQETDP
jgi:hypothetical protein